MDQGIEHTSEDLDLKEPIAVCGLSFRFPGGATSEEAFWEMLKRRRSVATEYPSSRLHTNSFYHPTRRNALCTRNGHFLEEDLSRFDADFFSITPSEAAAMDPMQRLLLEATVEALDNAGIRLEDIRGSRTSVHTGCFSSDYLHQILRDPQNLPPYAAVGASQSMLANRISWFFGFRGPSFNIDSACSSSAVAVECACQLLLSRQTDMGVAAGSNITLDPDFTAILGNNKMLSPDGRCYTFDHRANGYARGEGVAVVVLKRLSDALRHNDTIRAVIRAVASNQDGRTASITQPDTNAQSQLIHETYASAGLSLRHTRFFEAHGTGTQIGDPTEVAAIANVFHSCRTTESPLYLGALKTNIGHLEGASGLASLIKAVLAVESGLIPPNANFESLNPKLAAYDTCLAFPPPEGLPWPDAVIRRTSINSFGYGGSNCHIVVDDAASYLRRHGLQGNHRTVVSTIRMNGCSSPKLEDEEDVFPPRLLVWSATSEPSCSALMARYAGYCRNRPRESPQESQWYANLAYTLDSRRSVYAWRSYAVIASSSDLDNLGMVASKPQRITGTAPRVAFIFTGQGAQWYAMGRELISHPTFRNVIDEADTLFHRLGCSWSVRDELCKNESDSRIDEPYLAQPLTAILQIALVDLLASLQVRPVAVVGHSMGEIAAAYCAGLICLQSALRLAYYRGLFISSISKKDGRRGAMLAVGLSKAEVEPYLMSLRRQDSSDLNLVVACINSPTNVTIAGADELIISLQETLQAEGIFARRLSVSVAYHSPQIKQITEECLKCFGTIEKESSTTLSSSPKMRMISTVTGQPLSGERARQGTYWTENMVSPVLFKEAIEALCHDSVHSLRKRIDGRHRDAIVVDLLVEIGPHAALKLPIRETLSTIPRRVTYLPTLMRGYSSSKSLLVLLGQLFCAGLPLDLRQANEPSGPPTLSRTLLSDAPPYPFDHSMQYWSEGSLSRNYRLRSHGRLALLGSQSREWNPLEPQWHCRVHTSEMPWILEHRINGTSIYPAASMIAMAIQAVAQVTSGDMACISGYMFRGVQFLAPIAVQKSEDDDLETRLRLFPIPTQTKSKTVLKRWDFLICSTVGGSWQENCQGVIEVHYATATQSSFEPNEETTIAAAQVYDYLRKHGFEYGPSLQRMTATKLLHGRASATINLELPGDASPEYEEYLVHPASLDAIFQLAIMTLSRDGAQDIPTQAISGIGTLWIAKEGLQFHHGLLNAYARIDENDARRKIYSAYASLLSDRGQPEVIVGRLKTTVVSKTPVQQRLATAPGDKQFWYTVHCGVDMEMLSAKNVFARLQRICGPDAPGPRDFLRNVRSYLTIRMREIGSDIDTAKIPDSKAYLRRYVEWMDARLSREVNLTKPDDGYLKGLQSAIQQQGFLGKFFLTVADHAAGVLNGSVDIVQLLFASGMVDEYYCHQSPGSVYLQKLECYLASISFKRPSLAVLEVGAGTGSFTEHILNALRGPGSSVHFHSYCYTDISPAFLERGRSRYLQHASRMSFQVLDLDQDPLAQGFEAESFDLIAASNVLHVTKNLALALQALRRLLRPRGKLILHEITRPESLEQGFVFGLLPGWWPNATDSRSLSPTVSEEQWHLLLNENGFSGADLVLRDYADEEAHSMSVICSSAVDYCNSKPPAIPGGVEVDIIVKSACGESESSLCRSVYRALLREGYKPRLVSYAAESDAIRQQGLIVTLIEAETPFLSQLDATAFSTLKQMLMRAKKVLWVSGGGASTADPSFGMIDGFAQVFRIENPSSRFKILRFDGRIGPDWVTAALKQLTDEATPACLEDYNVVNGEPYLRRIYEDTGLKEKIMEKLAGFRLENKRLGDIRPFSVPLLDSRSATLMQEETPDALAAERIGPDEVDIELHSIPFEPWGEQLEFQFAGRVIRAGCKSRFLPGDRVCGCRNHEQVIRSTIRTHCKLVARIPDSLTFGEACLLPKNYLGALYLDQLLGVSKRSVIVIHGGETSLAHALIPLVLQRCSRLFVTVATEESVETLLRFCGGADIITYASFAAQFHQHCPQGASAVLDLASSDFMNMLDELSPFGMLITVQHRSDVRYTAGFNAQLPQNVIIHRVDMDAALSSQHMQLEMPPVMAAPLLQRQVQTMKLPSRTFLIPKLQPLTPSYYFDPAASYLIAGGLGDLGRSIAKWMVQRGARYLILPSRSGPRNGIARNQISALEAAGAMVYAPCCDIADGDSLGKVLQHCGRTMPIIKGCIQTTGVLRDIMYSRMTFEEWQCVLAPKVLGSWNLHTLLPRKMDFFILASSITGIVGQPTQINYAAANSYQDALARFRLSHGEKAVSLNLGVLKTGGLIAQNESLLDRLVSTNFHLPLSEEEVLALLDHFCDPSLAIDDIPAQVATGFIRPPEDPESHVRLPATLQQPFWDHIRVGSSEHVKDTAATAATNAASKNTFREMLAREGASMDEISIVVTEALADRFCQIALVPRDRLSIEKPLHAAGADSLIAVDLRNWVLQKLGVDLPVFDILGETPITALGRFIAQEMKAQTEALDSRSTRAR
ncbi:polyketide synthase [Aspergillus nidulans var. acristatus]